MESLTSGEITVMLLAVATLLLSALALGELARWLGQPAIIGELLAGIILGPSLLGQFFPDFTGWLFPKTGGVPAFLEGLSTLSVVLFLLVAGMELDLSTLWRQGRSAIVVGLSGLIFPFMLGLIVALLIPNFLYRNAELHAWTFALFFATALSISALPVIIKILLDLHLYRTDFGMLLVGAAVLNDLLGWIIFAAILSLGATVTHPFSLPVTVALVLGFAVFMLTAARWLFHGLIPWIQAYFHWPGGILGLTLALALLGAAFTEWIGVHAIFGSFLVGIAIGDSSHMRDQIRKTIEHFVSFFFAPIFFAGIGLHVNFVTSFDPVLCAVVFLVATIGKVGGGYLGARACQMPRPEALSVGVGLNARGMMEIILGLLALRFNLIGERLFVALIVMALLSSAISGPLILHILKLKKIRHFTQFLSLRGFEPKLQPTTRREAIERLAQLAAPITGLSAQDIAQNVWEREQIMGTGLENGLAFPHGRFDSISSPTVIVGVSQRGIPFGAEDGQLSHLIFMVLTPAVDSRAQLEILADIAKTFTNPELRERAQVSANFPEFLSVLKTALHS